jgi:protein ImuB
MSRLYACIISPEAKRDREMLRSVALDFSYLIEVIDDGILFDVSGLERLIGGPKKIAAQILERLRSKNISGSVAVAETLDTALLLARENDAASDTARLSDSFEQLPLESLAIEQDTLNVFSDLGLRTVEELLEVPRDELIGRYGREFQNVLDVIEQKGSLLLAPNVKDDRASWGFELDQPVEDFEQLIFVLNHGLDRLFFEVAHAGFSTEHLDVLFRLSDRTRKAYEIKASFPTLDKTFWLKLANLRIALDPPGSEIVSVNVTAHFTKPRASQRGLYAVSRPEPESLLLTVNKLRNLVGEANVGVPVMLDQRLAEPFALDAEALPAGEEDLDARVRAPVIAFCYFRPPLRAEVLVRNAQLVFLRTAYFSGHVAECSGVWRSNSKWWDKPWKTLEWDVEVENNGVYRLSKTGAEWFVTGVYD